MATPETSEDFWARFKAEDEEKRRVGEKCRKCGGYIFCLRAPGYSRLCSKCQSLDKAEGVRDNRYIRCPGCRFNWNPLDVDNGCWDNNLLDEGEHDINCPQCGHEFEVTTNVAYSFDSPALVADDPEPEDEDGEDDYGDDDRG